MRWQRIQELPTPVLLLDWTIAKRNIVKGAKMVEGTGAKLRPHFKSHKCVPLALEQIAGGNCAGFTAATVDEAEALVVGGVQDVLVANQIVTLYRIAQMVKLAKRATIRVPIQTVENASAIAAEAIRTGVTIGVLVEINIGHMRWGLTPGEQAVALAKKIANIPGLRFDGIQAYHGSGAHLKTAAERTEYARSTMEEALATKRGIEAAGIPCPIISGTGTSTFFSVLDMKGVTEFQAGTYVIMDWAFQERTGDLFEIALTVLATVITTTPDQFVLDVGLKAMGNRNGAPRLPELTGYEVLSYNAEEHTIVRLPGHKLKVGDLVRVQPSHANATMNLYRQVVVHEGDAIRHIWPISASGYALPESGS